MAPILVTGGTAADREAIARAFHRASPLRERGFLSLDCAADEPVLRSALHCWLLRTESARQANPLEPVAGGTLFLDRLEGLSEDGQRELLLLLRQIGGAGEPESGLPARVAVGCAAVLAGDSPIGVRPELLDCLDKIRVSAGGEDLRDPGNRGPGARIRRTGDGGGAVFVHSRP